MGVDYYATTVIGCEITEKAYKPVRERACSHATKIDDSFCSTCGRPAFKTIARLREELQNLEKFEIFSTTEETRTFIGIGSSVNIEYDEPERLDFETVFTVKDELKEFLTPLGLWQEDTFGIWTVPFASC